MRRVVKWSTIILLGLLVVIAIVFVLLPAVFASRLGVVYSGSMEPAMPVGAIVWMEPVDPAQIKVGDIIAFNPPWDPDATVSHRVIEVIEAPTLGFYTKGDVNEDPDFDTVPADNVLARVSFNIHNLGYVLGYIRQYTRGPLGFTLSIALPTVLLIGSAMRDMNFMLSPAKRRARQLKKMMERRKRSKFH